MPVENEAVVQRWWQDLWNRGDLAVADQIIAPNFTDYDPQSPWVPPGIDGCKALVSGYRTVFPDLHFTIEQQVAGGDSVVSHWRGRGTHRAELMGIPATGKPIDVQGISVLHLENGKIYHQTTIWDALGLLQQIGAVGVFGAAKT
jgi:steroid delta-isomerase-like uncharacterized protein